jgi:ribosomal protein S8
VWSYKKVFKDTQNTSTIYLFETSYGFLTQNIMLKKRIGGSPICSISF